MPTKKSQKEKIKRFKREAQEGLEDLKRQHKDAMRYLLERGLIEPAQPNYRFSIPKPRPAVPSRAAKAYTISDKREDATPEDVKKQLRHEKAYEAYRDFLLDYNEYIKSLDDYDRQRLEERFFKENLDKDYENMRRSPDIFKEPIIPLPRFREQEDPYNSPFRMQLREDTSLGRFGDTLLAHLNPEEFRLLESRRGRPADVNPWTGLPELFDPGDAPGDPGVAGVGPMGGVDAADFGGRDEASKTLGSQTGPYQQIEGYVFPGEHPGVAPAVGSPEFALAQLGYGRSLSAFDPGRQAQVVSSLLGNPGLASDYGLSPKDVTKALVAAGREKDAAAYMQALQAPSSLTSPPPTNLTPTPAPTGIPALPTAPTAPVSLVDLDLGRVELPSTTDYLSAPSVSTPNLSSPAPAMPSLSAALSGTPAAGPIMDLLDMSDFEMTPISQEYLGPGAAPQDLPIGYETFTSTPTLSGKMVAPADIQPTLSGIGNFLGALPGSTSTIIDLGGPTESIGAKSFDLGAPQASSVLPSDFNPPGRGLSSQSVPANPMPAIPFDIPAVSASGLGSLGTGVMGLGYALAGEPYAPGREAGPIGFNTAPPGGDILFGFTGSPTESPFIGGPYPDTPGSFANPNSFSYPGVSNYSTREGLAPSISDIVSWSDTLPDTGITVNQAREMFGQAPVAGGTTTNIHDLDSPMFAPDLTYGMDVSQLGEMGIGYDFNAAPFAYGAAGAVTGIPFAGTIASQLAPMPTGFILDPTELGRGGGAESNQQLEPAAGPFGEGDREAEVLQRAISAASQAGLATPVPVSVGGGDEEEQNPPTSPPSGSFPRFMYNPYPYNIFEYGQPQSPFPGEWLFLLPQA